MDVEPLPNVGMSHVLGLCEVLDDRGGRDDVYKLARDLNFKFAELLLTIKAAEMLGLVTTPGGDAVLTPLGKQAIDGDVNAKKAIMKAQMEKLALFQRVRGLLVNAPEKAVDKDTLLQELAILLPNENPKTVFNTLVNWGRYGDIFGYSRDTDRFFLQEADRAG